MHGHDDVESFSTFTYPRLFSRRILILDDSLADRKLMAAILRKVGAVPIGYGSVPEAKEALVGFTARVKPDVILCDLMMPKEHGGHFIQWLHRMKGLPDIPVIVVSGDSRKETIRAVAELGVKGYLLKPIDAQGLCSRIDAALLEAQSPSAGGAEGK